RHLVLSGTARPGALVEVSVDKKVLGTVKADAATGAFTFDAGDNPLADGKHIFYAHEVDAEGTGISDFAAYAVTVDTVAPDIAIGTVAGDGIVNDAEDNALVVSGTAPGAEDGQTVTVTFSDGNPATADITATATVAGGKWAIAPTDTSALAAGPVAIAAEVTAKAGQPASASTTVTLWSGPEHLPQIAIETPIAGDGMVNAAEQGAVAVSGTTVNIA